MAISIEHFALLQRRWIGRSEGDVKSNRPAAAGRHSSQRIQFRRRIQFVMRWEAHICFSNTLAAYVRDFRLRQTSTRQAGSPGELAFHLFAATATLKDGAHFHSSVRGRKDFAHLVLVETPAYFRENNEAMCEIFVNQLFWNA